MKPLDFALQSKVWDKDDKTRTGVVIGNALSTPDLVAVEWSDGTLAKVHVDLLLREEDMALELEFQAINAKVEEAARLLSEAALAAGKLGKDLNDYNYDTDERYFPAIDDMMGAIDDAGWRSSSLSC